MEDGIHKPAGFIPAVKPNPGIGMVVSKNYDPKSYYCVFCHTSKEKEVERSLSGAGYSVITSLTERTVHKNGKETKELRTVMPGYVFFESEKEPEWSEIEKKNHVFYALHYGKNEKKLRGSDLMFVKWLAGNSGTMKISKAVKTGTKIKIVEGPLKEMEGMITKINSRQKCAKVTIKGGIVNTSLWLSYEVIEAV